jgi:hypothetical protein
MWKYFKNYMYGEEGGISQEMLSYEKLLPPAWNKAIQYLQKDGSSQYGYQYALQARTQDLLWRAGAREDYPTSEEIMNRTNGMFLLRMAGNLLAFTPPNYQSPIQPLIDIQRAYDEKYGLEGPMKFSENFGNEMLILSSTDSTRNVGGTTTSVGTVRNIKNYDGLVREVAGSVSNEDLDVLGILVNEDLANSEYDINAYRWMQQENIPGTTRKWRETNSGGESMAEQMGVPFLGRLPIYEPIRVGSDVGIPLVIAEPESGAAQAFTKVASQMAAQVSMKALRGQLEKGTIPLTPVR